MFTRLLKAPPTCSRCKKDPKLESYTDQLIETIAAAQEPDGYLYTARTIQPDNPPGRASKERWLNERGALGNGDSHELYNAGHMYEAAVAYFQATGKRKFLEVAIRHADLVARNFGPGPDQLKIPSGHQEIEIGLVKLYRVTGDRKYLDLAKFLLDCRGRHLTDAKAKRRPDPYYADHEPVTEQAEAVGHAVRSAYMYSAMADVAALTGDPDYFRAVDRLWQNVVTRKLHVTGGIGASPAGEAFGGDYDLPNASAYNETCAAIANGLWNHRMFLLHGDAKYLDVLERVIYNGFLSGVGMSGDRFFYPNPLESDGEGKFNHGHNDRAPWFGCSCCPVNVVRFIPSIAGYIYATRGDELFVNLFIGGSAQTEVAGVPLAVRQTTDYPWDGKVTLELTPKRKKQFTLNLRIPGWVRAEPVPGDLYRYEDAVAPAVRIAVNGEALSPRLDKGFARIQRTWAPGDRVTLEMAMTVRKVVAHTAVKANEHRFALERGPVVYCAEGADNPNGVLETYLPGPLGFKTERQPGLLGGVVTVKVAAAESGTVLTLIPYYAWCHRGPNEMRVWHPTRQQVRLASHCWEMDTVEACFDGKLPKASGDHEVPRFTWWPRQGSAEWVLRRFEVPMEVTAAEVYWFDDTGKGGCRVPRNWRLLYREGGQWKPVEATSEYGTALDRFNRVTFKPVTTPELRLEAVLQTGFSAGVLEWRTEP